MPRAFYNLFFYTQTHVDAHVCMHRVPSRSLGVAAARASRIDMFIVIACFVHYHQRPALFYIDRFDNCIREKPHNQSGAEGEGRRSVSRDDAF